MHLLKNTRGVLTGVYVDNFFLRIDIRVRSSLKRLTLRLDSSRNCLRVSANQLHRNADLEDFILKSEDWLRKGLQSLKPPLLIKPGETLEILGTSYTLEVQKGPRELVFQKDKLLVSCESSKDFRRTLEGGLKEHAFAFFYEKSYAYGGLLGKVPTRIIIRDFKSRWGSCSRGGDLSYSWRLIFAPREVAEYVCAHEVSHLKEMNHGPAFWALVRKLCPFYKVYRMWLRTEGSSLFRMEWEEPEKSFKNEEF